MRKIFGTATLHRMSRRSKERLVEAAIDQGFDYFDTAGVYGLGSTNRFLGNLGINSNVKFSAKIGLIAPSVLTGSVGELFFRKTVLKKRSLISEDNNYSSWRRSFEKQLSDLNTDKVSALFLHERLMTKETLEAFERFCSEYAGHFERVGISANYENFNRAGCMAIPNNYLVQTTPRVFNDPSFLKRYKTAVFGVSKNFSDLISSCNSTSDIDGVIYYSSKVERLNSFSKALSKVADT